MSGKRNMRLPELAGKFELILVFGLLSIIINHNIKSHVEEHNETVAVFTVL